MNNKNDTKTRKTHIKELVVSYKNNFTVHGMTKIFTGHPIERVIWFGLLLSCLFFVGRESRNFIKEYMAYDIRTEVRMTAVENITLPTMTLCSMGPQEMIAKGLYWKNISLAPNIPQKTNTTSSNQTKALIHFVRGPAAMHVLPHSNFPTCIIINSRLNMTSSTPFSESFIYFGPQIEMLYLYVHNRNDISFSLRNMNPTAIIEVGMNEILFKNKRIFYRLKHPYPSDCKDASDKWNEVGENYSVNKCKDKCAIEQQMKECNTTLDIWQHYIQNLTKSIKSPNQCTKGLCDLKIRKCLRDSLLSPNHCTCRPSCYEEIVDTVMNKAISNDGTNRNIKLKFVADNILTTITEVPAYPSNKFITDIGGWLGLFSGMSILSVAEIIIFLMLSIMALMERKRGDE